MSKNKILTFGYGNRTNYEDLSAYIEEYGVTFLVDVRKKPRGWSAIWSAAKLASFCEEKGITYLSKTALGNDSGNSKWIPPNLSEAQEALDEISVISQSNNVLLMCAEKDWKRCHRVEVSENLRDSTQNAVMHLA